MCATSQAQHSGSNLLRLLRLLHRRKDAHLVPEKLKLKLNLAHAGGSGRTGSSVLFYCTRTLSEASRYGIGDTRWTFVGRSLLGLVILVTEPT